MAYTCCDLPFKACQKALVKGVHSLCINVVFVAVVVQVAVAQAR